MLYILSSEISLLQMSLAINDIDVLTIQNEEKQQFSSKFFHYNKQKYLKGKIEA